MKVIADATPLIALSIISQLDILPQLFDTILVPNAVYDEVAIKGTGRPGAVALANASWIKVQDPEASPTIEPMLLGLDSGELQVLLLAREVQPDWVLIDERLGRRVAQAMGIPVKGTLGVLLAAFHAGFISQEQALNALQQLDAHGIRTSSRVKAWFESEVNQTRE